MVLGYEREWTETGQKAAVLLNFSDQIQRVSMQKYEGFRILISNQSHAGLVKGNLNYSHMAQ